MIYYLTYIKDIANNNYIGIDISNSIVDPYISKLYEIENDCDKYINMQKNRDHGKYHITVINVMEYNSIIKNNMLKSTTHLDNLLKHEIDDLKMMGIGSAERNGNKAYFIVCKSESLGHIRDFYNLPNHDFHITLGFWHKDVFGVPKNKVLDYKSKFLELLKLEFYKKENFNFLKRIENYQTNHDFDIIPISISNKCLKIYSDGVIMDIGILDDQNKLWVMATYKAEKEPVRLPMTEILKTLKK